MSDTDYIDDEMAEAIATATRQTAALRMEAARLQLTCAALTGIVSEEWRTNEIVASQAVGLADACLALLYPEEASRGK